jgi:C-terminal processing protease CtpA/Prc
LRAPQRADAARLLSVLGESLAPRTTRGEGRVEGVGVSPDIDVPLDLTQLRQGKDNQLDAAIRAAATAQVLRSERAVLQTT